MGTAIRKHLRDFVAILALLLVALVVTGVILSHQRLSLPQGVPLLGSDTFELDAELATAQAVTPGQGQTVNIAGVEVGQISSVKLEDGTAVVGMRIDNKYSRIYRDATILLRPKTGLKDMVLELNPGTPQAGRLNEGDRIPISQTLPDVNLDEILASLDADTRDYVRVLLNDGARGLKGTGRPLARAIRRFEPTARYARKINEQLAERRRNLSRAVHSLSLLMQELGAKDRQVSEFVDSSNAVFATLAGQDANLRAALRELPGALDVTRTTLGKVDRLARVLGPTLEDLRPAARALGPSLRQVRPFLTQTTPVLRDEIRPFTRAALPTVRELQPALTDLAAATPNLTRSFRVVNALLNTLAYNPPGNTNEGFLFWLSWANHVGATVFATQDAHGPIRHGIVVFSCSTAQVLDAVASASPALGTLVDLLNGPSVQEICPQSAQAPGGGG
jgi:phospholipid/cholesterol/gamma-HCH transport system substrate-binding protein